jgi:hypothetical protein
MNIYKERVQALPRIEDVETSYRVFLMVYDWYRPQEWAAEEHIFVVGNAIARYRPDLISVGIRLNVQVNLFLKSVRQFGTPDQWKQIGAKIGCFALTEIGAGVLSGMILQMTFESVDGGYILDTPSEDAEKQWISQGLVSVYTLCVARNIHDVRDVRMFVVPSSIGQREPMALTSVEVAHTVDLAHIVYRKCLVPADSLLPSSVGIPRRVLLSGICDGRYMIAEASVQSILCLCARILSYLDVRPSSKRIMVEDVGTVRDFEEKTREYGHHLADRRRIVLQYRRDLVPFYKIVCTEWAIEAYVNLHMRFTTYAMRAGVAFHTTILNKVAEGDTDVLRLSLVADDARQTVLSRLYYWWRVDASSTIQPATPYDCIQVYTMDCPKSQRVRILSSIIIRKNIVLPPDSSLVLHGFTYRPNRTSFL